jgi:hypothetical protein
LQSQFAHLAARRIAAADLVISAGAQEINESDLDVFALVIPPFTPGALSHESLAKPDNVLMTRPCPAMLAQLFRKRGFRTDARKRRDSRKARVAASFHQHFDVGGKPPQLAREADIFLEQEFIRIRQQQAVRPVSRFAQSIAPSRPIQPAPIGRLDSGFAQESPLAQWRPAVRLRGALDLAQDV